MLSDSPEQSHLKNGGPGSLHGVSVLLLLKASADLVGLFMQVPAGVHSQGVQHPLKRTGLLGTIS